MSSESQTRLEAMACGASYIGAFAGEAAWERAVGGTSGTVSCHAPAPAPLCNGAGALFYAGRSRDAIWMGHLTGSHCFPIFFLVAQVLSYVSRAYILALEGLQRSQRIGCFSHLSEPREKHTAVNVDFKSL